MRITTSRPVTNWCIFKMGATVAETEDSPIKSDRIIDWMSDASLGSCLCMFDTRFLSIEHARLEIFHLKWDENHPIYLQDEGYNDETTRDHVEREAIVDRIISLGDGLFQIISDDKSTFQKCYHILDWNKKTLLLVTE
ncbi:hypothetical protein IKG13_00535 [Candidatus Saccharibacteria bacterium]|nr:hypothetical protein [Candidatus Saccharibacteria bacterium]MBR3378276.1 hypothetical protein [Candidatus Saccharibacteria bacterium]